MRRSSHKGWHKVGTYTTLSAAEKMASKQRRRGNKAKITENKGKVRVTPSGKRVLHPADYPGGKLKTIYRVYAK